MSIQSNRIVTLGGLDGMPALEELYLSHNGILTVQGLDAVAPTLTTLDLSNNRLTSLAGLPTTAFVALEELWVNDNQLADAQETERLLASLPPTVNTLYLERNPLAAHPQYRNKITAVVPQLTQLDGTPVTRSSLLLNK